MSVIPSKKKLMFYYTQTKQQKKKRETSSHVSNSDWFKQRRSVYFDPGKHGWTVLEEPKDYRKRWV